MEFLVTMTTHVPDGTTSDEVDAVRAREAAHTRELAAQGQVLRLWRPPLAPGEWRTLGLFAAAEPAQLEQVLASMPLRVWRTDDVQELSAHPDDPAPGIWSPNSLGARGTEFLVTFTLAVPGGTAPDELGDARTRQAQRTGDLARQGHLVRLWELPGQGQPWALGLWRAVSPAEMAAILDGLPLSKYLANQVTELTPHPSDPMAPGSRPPAP
jgi:muconolactone delta-isomerase